MLRKISHVVGVATQKTVHQWLVFVCVFLRRKKRERNSEGGLEWNAPWQRTAAILVEFSM